MSKSLGNLEFAHDLLTQWSPAALRLALMNYHYRVGGEWYSGRMGAAEALASKLRSLVGKAELPDTNQYLMRIRAALDNDLDMPSVLRELTMMAGDRQQNDHDLPQKRTALHKMFDLLGLF